MVISLFYWFWPFLATSDQMSFVLARLSKIPGQHLLIGKVGSQVVPVRSRGVCSSVYGSKLRGPTRVGLYTQTVCTKDLMPTLGAFHKSGVGLVCWVWAPFSSWSALNIPLEGTFWFNFVKKDLVCDLKHLKLSWNGIFLVLWAHFSGFILASSRSFESQKQFTCTYIIPFFLPLIMLWEIVLNIF